MRRWCEVSPTIRGRKGVDSWRIRLPIEAVAARGRASMFTPSARPKMLSNVKTKGE